MKKSKSSIYLIYILLIVFFIVVDRITKFLALKIKEPLNYGIFSFDLVKNTGASWGMLKNSNLLLIGVSIAVLAIIIYYRKQIPKIPLVLVTSGLIGNLIDRFIYGYVIDLIDFKFWPVFNIADSLISIGVVWYIILLITAPKSHHRNPSDRNN
jgi:signal peptidase II